MDKNDLIWEECHPVIFRPISNQTFLNTPWMSVGPSATVIPPLRGLNVVTVTTARLIPGLFGLAEEERAAQEMTSCLGGKSLESWVGPPGRLRRAERKHYEKMTQSSYLNVQSDFIDDMFWTVSALLCFSLVTGRFLFHQTWNLTLALHPFQNKGRRGTQKKKVSTDALRIQTPQPQTFF